jgi:hypothetical protein
MQKTKLLVIVITTAAIIAAATTTSLSAATPAFARVNCTFTGTLETCRGGTTFGTARGGFGGQFTFDFGSQEITSDSGGFGGKGGGLVGGGGGYGCDSSSCPVPLAVGGSGLHERGPGGNSGN